MNLCTIIKLIMFRIFFSQNSFTRFLVLDKVIYHYKWVKKVVNIRAQPQIQNNSIKTQSSDLKNQKDNGEKLIREKISYQQERKHFESLIPQKITSQSYNLNAQAHLINKNIKNLTTLYQLFKLHNKYKNRLNVNQYLKLFQKLAYIQHFGQENNRQQLKNLGIKEGMLIENYVSIMDGLKKLLFSTSHAPEIYIDFIYTLSKCHNQFLYNKGFQEIFVKIIKNQLLVAAKQQSKQKNNIKNTKIPKQNVDDNIQLQKQNQIDKEKSQNYVSTSQVISIFNNYKLAQALLRILNHRTAQYKNQNVKLMLSLLREVVTFLHTPSTPNQITNQSLFELVYQYTIIYPHLKLPNGVLKSLIRQCLTRVKYEDILKKIQNKKKISKQNQLRLEQITIVNSIKKLLLLQSLLIQQTKVTALRKQILQTKPNNIQFSSFYKIEHKVHKYIVELLPRCKIYCENIQLIGKQDTQQKQQISRSHGPLWQHIQLISMLKNHVKLMMIDTPIDILSKSELLMSTYNEFEAIIQYLSNIYRYSVEVNKNNSLQINKRKKFFIILIQSYNLLYMMMKKQLQLRIPATIVNKCINGKLIKLLIEDFNYLTKQLKIFIISYLLNYKNNTIKTNIDKNQINNYLRVDNQLITELIISLLNPDKDNQGQFKRASKIATGCWYIRFLVANQQYLSFINNQLKVKEQQMAYQSFQSVIQDIQEYIRQEQDFKEQTDNGCKKLEDISQVIKKLGIKIGKHLRNIQNNQAFNKILQIYQKQSNKNSMLTERQFKQIQKNKGKYQTKISGWGTRLKLQQKRRQNKIKKITISYTRVELMLNVMEQYFGSRQDKIDQKKKVAKILMDIYEKQRQYLFGGQYKKNMQECDRKRKIDQLFVQILGKKQQQEIRINNQEIMIKQQ